MCGHKISKFITTDGPNQIMKIKIIQNCSFVNCQNCEIYFLNLTKKKH